MGRSGRNLRRTVLRGDGDESSGLAGWLFADLILGLSVIFLALTAVRTTGTGASNVECQFGKELVREHYPTPLVANLQAGSYDRVVDVIAKFAKDNGLKNETVAAGVISGWYESQSRDGRTLAQGVYRDVFSRLDGKNFPTSSTENFKFIGDNSSLKRDEVGIWLVFTTNKERCKSAES
jgi:hypothetical protein